MARYKIIYLLLLTNIVYVSAKEAEDRISLKPPDKLVLHKSAPYTQQEPTFFSKVKNWFFPATDAVPAETQHGGPQYLPPQPYQSEPDCNPCNKAPWIPIASNIGHNTLINFVPPSSHPPNSQYGPPPASQYGPPPSSNYASISQHRPAPSSNYGPPVSFQYGPPLPLKPVAQYGAPPPVHELSADYRPPLPIHNPPVQNRPAFPQYGPPFSSPGSNFRQSSFLSPPPAPQSFRPNFAPLQPSFRPRPDKLLPVEDLRPPPPVTHLKPVLQTYVAIGMKPPPLPGNYHASTSSSANYNLPPPPPPPSDSYGAPITGPNADYQIRPEYLPPVEQLPLASAPIPLPNLGPYPIAPIYNAQMFHLNDNVQQGARYNVQTNQNVQVLPSVKVADYLATIEHPINVIQSPLVEVSVNNHEEKSPEKNGFYEDNSKLSENPIVVDDTFTAASNINVTVQGAAKDGSYRANGEELLNSNLIKQLLLHQDSSSRNKSFTAPSMDYSQWEPTWGNTISSSVVPPPVQSTWLQPVGSTTKKPKQIQIIVPYVTNKNPNPFDNAIGRMVPSKPYTTLLPVYSPPVTTEEVWSKFMEDFNYAESKKVTATAFTPPTTQVYNIKDILKNTNGFNFGNKLPFDVISFQNNIDEWTQQSYSKTLPKDEKLNPVGKFVPSKKIPEDFLTTTLPDTTTPSYDHEEAASNKKESKLEDDIESNFIIKETTTEGTTTTQPVTVLPNTKEKVYIVTPQPYRDNSTPKTAWSHPPKVQNLNNTIYPTPKFLIRVDPEDKGSRDKLKDNSGLLTVVFSEWPHLINNLQTTTPTLPTSNHPLLGLMDLAKYTPPPNATIQTITGHSRVVTVVTPVTEKIRNVK